MESESPSRFVQQEQQQQHTHTHPPPPHTHTFTRGRLEESAASNDLLALCTNSIKLRLGTPPHITFMKLAVDLINASREKRGKGKREKRGRGGVGGGVYGEGGGESRAREPSIKS